MAADLVRRNVAVILVGGSIPGVRAVTAATQTISIFFTTNTDPVATGIVPSQLLSWMRLTNAAGPPSPERQPAAPKAAGADRRSAPANKRPHT
jgi:hypothetical protein